MAELTEGIDANDLNGPVVRRTRHRAGVVKVAGSLDGPSARDRRIFEAAATATARVGVPLLTHCEGGTGGVAQLRLLEELRRAPGPGDPVPHRQGGRPRLPSRAALSGAYAVYDQGIRDPEGTARLVRWMVSTATGTGSCSAPTAPGGRCGRCSAAPRAWPPSAPTWASGWPTSSARRPWTASGSPTRPPPWGCAREPGPAGGQGASSPGPPAWLPTRSTGSPARAPRSGSWPGDRDQCEALACPTPLADLRATRARPRPPSRPCAAPTPGRRPLRRGRGQRRPLGDGPAHELTLKAWEGTFALNATPAFLAAREALRAMLDQPPAPRPPAARWC